MGERERKSSVSFLSFCSFVATHFVCYCLCSNRFCFFLLCLFNNCLLCNSTILFRILHGRDPTRPFDDCRSTWKKTKNGPFYIWKNYLYMKWLMLVAILNKKRKSFNWECSGSSKSEHRMVWMVHSQIRFRIVLISNCQPFLVRILNSPEPFQTKHSK